MDIFASIFMTTNVVWVMESGDQKCDSTCCYSPNIMYIVVHTAHASFTISSWQLISETFLFEINRLTVIQMHSIKFVYIASCVILMLALQVALFLAS